MRVAVLSASILLAPAVAGGVGFNAAVQEFRSNTSVLCSANHIQRSPQFGAMWSCRPKEDIVHLFVSEDAKKPGQVRRVLFKAERPLSKDFTQTQRRFIQSVFEHYDPRRAKDLLITFFACTEKNADTPQYRLEFDCYQGSSIRSHTVIAYPKQ